MKILAMETTGVSGSVALAWGDKIVASRALAADSRSAETLIPAISELCAEAGWKIDSLDLIALAVGCGSFTGLRVGVTCAKMLAWSIKAKVVGLDTHSVIAHQTVAAADEIRRKNGAVFASDGENSADFIVSIGIDAQRREAAVRDFLIHGKSCFALTSGFRLQPVAEWLALERIFEFLPMIPGENYSEWGENSDRNVLWEKSRTETPAPLEVKKVPRFFAGPLLQKWGVQADAAVSERLVPSDLWEPTAEQIALCAFRRASEERFDDPWRLVPVYSRISAAEEKLLEKNR